jgi:hypothetical protein
VISAIGVNVHYLRFHPRLFGVTGNAVCDVHARRRRDYTLVISRLRSGLITETHDDFVSPIFDEGEAYAA